MDKKAHVEVYKLRTIERCETSPQIKLMSMNNSKNMYEYLANIDGTYQSFLGFPQEEHLREIVAFYPNMPTDQKGSRYIWEYSLEVATDEYLLFLEQNPTVDRLSVVNYKNNKSIVQLLKSHRQVIWKDGGRENKNNNIKSDVVIFELVNTTEITSVKTKLEKLAIEASAKINFWSEFDSKTYLNFCYLWGVQGIETFTKEALFSSMINSVKSNLDKYREVIGWLDNETRIYISMGLATLLKDESKKTIITKDGNYYTFNKELAGVTIDEVVNYFTTHPQSYRLLKNLLDVKDNIDVELPSAPKVSMDKNEITPAISLAEQEKEKEKHIAEIERKLTQVKEGKNVMGEKEKGRFPLIDNVLITTTDVLAQLASTEIVVKHGLQNHYWAKAKEYKLTN